jgi:Protein of unknown function (DUF3455)
MFHPFNCLCVLLVCAGCSSKGSEAPAASPVVVLPAAAPSAAAPAPAAAAAPETPAATATPTPAMPPELALPDNLKLVLEASAKGVQIYACSAKKDDPKAFEWKLKAPEAALFNDRGEKVAKHFAGPTWESVDGSSVGGVVVGKADSPDPQAIAWLRLDCPTHKGTGAFSHVAQVRRVDTAGGKAPKDGCDAAHTHAEIRVPYTAKYQFYAPSAG